MKTLINEPRARTSFNKNKRSKSDRKTMPDEHSSNKGTNPTLQALSGSKIKRSTQHHPLRFIEQTFAQLLYENDYRPSSKDFENEPGKFPRVRDSANNFDGDSTPKQKRKRPYQKHVYHSVHQNVQDLLHLSSSFKTKVDTTANPSQIWPTGIPIEIEPIQGHIDIVPKKITPFVPISVSKSYDRAPQSKFVYIEQNQYKDDRGWIFAPFRFRHSVELPTSAVISGSAHKSGDRFSGLGSQQMLGKNPSLEIQPVMNPRQVLPGRLPTKSQNNQGVIDELGKLIAEIKSVADRLDNLKGLVMSLQLLGKIMQGKLDEFNSIPHKELPQPQGRSPDKEMEVLEMLMEFASFYNIIAAERNLKTKLALSKLEKELGQMISMVTKVVSYFMDLQHVEEALFITAVLLMVLVSYEDSVASYINFTSGLPEIMQKLVQQGPMMGNELEEARDEIVQLNARLMVLDGEETHELRELEIKLQRGKEENERLEKMVKERDALLQGLKSKGAEFSLKTRMAKPEEINV